MNKKLETWLGQAEEILGSLEKAQQLSGWRFIQAELEGAKEIGFDDSSWEEVKGDPKWSPAAGTAWQRKELIFSPCIEGISLKGSEVYLIAFAPSGTEIFLDGKSLAKDSFFFEKGRKSSNLISIPS